MARPVIPMRRAAIAAGCALALAACLPAATRTTGRPIGEDRVRSIAPGTTTKSGLFERFGPPAAIVARREIAVVPVAPVHAGGAREGTHSYGFDADTFFELFPPGPDPGGYRRIYYYRRVESDARFFYMVLSLYARGETKTDRLWVLVDEKRGIVEDYAFRKSGGPTVFGVPRAAPPR